MVAIYRIAISAYALSIRIAALFKVKARLFIAGRQGLLDKLQEAFAGEHRPRIWIHCASLGEFEQGRPIIEALKVQYPRYAILLTFFSPSGYEVRKDYKGVDYVFYLPVDSPNNASRFIDIVKPSLCIFVKYELWYYFLKKVVEYKSPLLLVSAAFNVNQGFFKWYGSLQRAMLRRFSHIFVQDDASKKLLDNINISNVTIGGDTRFDRIIAAIQQPLELAIMDEFCKTGKIIIAGSTWEDDEIMLEKAFKQLPEQYKLVLVPHETDTVHISKIEKLFGSNMVKWSDLSKKGIGAPIRESILLVDKVGLLLSIYRYGTLAWIGGGFGKAGVHNVLEAAGFGIPCIFGPVYQQFIEAGQLIESGGGFSVTNSDSFVGKVLELDNKDRYQKCSAAAKSYVVENGGATAKVMHYIEGIIID
jgi:3-deoxy-D-manno-octulosonic-acid transferase